MHAHTHMYTHSTTAPPWFNCFSLQAWMVRAVWPGNSAWGLFNPLGFSQNASAPFNGEKRISTQLPQSPPLSPGVSLYLHMSKKQELWRSPALFIPAPKSCPRSLHLPFPPRHCKLLKCLAYTWMIFKHSAYLVFPQKWPGHGCRRSLCPPCCLNWLQECAELKEFSWNKAQRGKEVTRENERWATLTE